MFMTLFSLFLFAAAAFAQSVTILQPPAGTPVAPGSTVVVQIARPNTLSSSEEVAVVLGFQSCAYGPCASPADIMGDILYNGPFNPEYHEEYMPPYENITVQIPSFAANGTAILAIAHFFLLGAGLYPDMEVLNQTITVV